MRPTAAQVAALLGVEPLPVEGGLFRQTWRGAPDGDGRPVGTAIVAMLTDDPDSFSAMHRLSTDEVWHFQLGDPVRMLLIGADGRHSEPILGHDLLAGHRLTVVVPAGTWMGASLAPGGSYGVFACTMSPGFTSGEYEGGTLADLTARCPQAAERIAELVRPDEPTTRMPSGL